MGGKSERLEMRVAPVFIRAIDEWRRVQPDLPSRGEAIRRLVVLGLRADGAGAGNGAALGPSARTASRAPLPEINADLRKGKPEPLDVVFVSDEGPRGLGHVFERHAPVPEPPGAEARPTEYVPPGHVKVAIVQGPPDTWPPKKPLWPAKLPTGGRRDPDG